MGREHLADGRTLLEAVKGEIGSRGLDWDFVLENLYVSELADAIVAVHPGWSTSADQARDLLAGAVPGGAPSVPPRDRDCSRRGPTAAFTDPEKLPCALIVLDEMQQYINDDPDRAQQVQLLIEACSQSFGGQVLVVATGQSALSATAVLQKLMDRFTVNVQLSDQDVETVIRKVSNT